MRIHGVLMKMYQTTFMHECKIKCDRKKWENFFCVSVGRGNNDEMFVGNQKRIFSFFPTRRIITSLALNRSTSHMHIEKVSPCKCFSQNQMQIKFSPSTLYHSVNEMRWETERQSEWDGGKKRGKQASWKCTFGSFQIFFQFSIPIAIN